jgi:hypothetical protein
MDAGQVVTSFDPLREVWVNRIGGGGGTLGAYGTEREAVRDAHLFAHFVAHFAWPAIVPEEGLSPTPVAARG